MSKQAKVAVASLGVDNLAEFDLHEPISPPTDSLYSCVTH